MALVPLAFGQRELTTGGVLLAVASGALTSGIGYAIWYAALRGHSVVSAALSQLTVPIVAAGLAVALLGETWTSRLGLSTALVLFGVGIGLRRPR